MTSRDSYILILDLVDIIYVTKETVDAIKIKDIINYPGSPSIITRALEAEYFLWLEEEAMPQKRKTESLEAWDRLDKLLLVCKGRGQHGKNASGLKKLSDSWLTAIKARGTSALLQGNDICS